jgi:hypothetical protein
VPVKVSNGKDTYSVDERRLSEAQKDGFVPVVTVTNGKQTHEVHPSKLNMALKDGFKPLEPPTEKSLGSKVMENVVDPALTAMDYTYAPVRQVMAAPAKIAQGRFADAVMDPINQLRKSPKEAPSTSEVLEMYGVPKEKKVAPIVMANPLMGSSYEQNPMEDDPDNVTIYPSAQGAALVDMVAGGSGITAAGKAASKVIKGVGKVASQVSKASAPLVKTKENAEKIVERC